ncbi:MAG: hypothetical protein ACW96X_10465, partial [Promethearchaeota archaeon]
MNINITSSAKKKGRKRINYKIIILLTTLIFIFTFSFINSDKLCYFNFSESANSQLSTSNIIGEDNRERVTPTTSHPWSAIVKLYMTWGTDVYIGSGAMIDKNHV